MRVVALISGGKDSCFNMMSCIAEGHDVVALANLRPEKKDELDSYMYQTVGHHAIDLYSEAMEIPLYARIIKGTSICIGRDYVPQAGDEVEDLYELLSEVKREKNVDAVSVGAILSDYQRVRVENVCQRLQLKVLSFLWRREQEQLLREIIACGVKAIIIKVAAMGLTPDKHLGLELSEILPHMVKMKSEFGLNECGEGGEYETFVLDCPLFKKSLKIEEKECIIHSNDAFAPVGYLNFKQCSLQTKDWDPQKTPQERVLALPITTSTKWVLEHHALCSKYDSEDTEPKSKENSEIPPVSNSDVLKPCYYCNGSNFCISGVKAVITETSDIAEATKIAMETLLGCLNEINQKASAIVSISLYVQNMSNFTAINAVFSKYFGINPPVRLCIEASLPPNVPLQLDCQGLVAKEADGSDCKTMHVQALSHWAPANIGPYSQAVMAGGRLLLAGMIALIPASLAVIDGGISTQARVSLTHVQRVLKAMQPSCHISHCPLVMCFVTHFSHIAKTKIVWKDTLEESEELIASHLTPVIQFCVVPRLPKDALVEWQVVAWPSLEPESEIQVESFQENVDEVTITVLRQQWESQTSLYMSLDSRLPESTENVETQVLVERLLLQYSKTCHCPDVQEPLIKVFFPVSIFDYTDLHNCFSECALGLKLSISVPVISLVPVTSLEATQLLVWCQ